MGAGEPFAVPAEILPFRPAARDAAQARVRGPLGSRESEVSEAIGERYPGRELSIYRDEGLGAGVKVSAGDDIVDASVKGYLRELLEEIGKA